MDDCLGRDNTLQRPRDKGQYSGFLIASCCAVRPQEQGPSTLAALVRQALTGRRYGAAERKPNEAQWRSPRDCGLPSRSAAGLIRNMQRVP